jgi:serine/threonine-protein kinase
MSELIGRTLGHYRIVEKIGAGGMGEVYRARDERLGREAAIKVLPEAVANDPERLARFEREAKLLAVLSHQNIATLYGLEEHNGQRFLVMELAEGETLAERNKKGPISIDEALPMALQIAEGLEAAHGQGIIHRDLKPANVMVSPDGRVKILDFGLAKAWQPDPINGDVSESPTLTAQMTATGVLLGTAAYMSPEQARGKSVDKRSDIWAFGCLFYEMLTGRRAFKGSDASESLAAILKEEPDWNALPANTSESIRRLLMRCLRKSSHDRLHDMADARIEIRDSELQPPQEPTAKTRFQWIWILAVGGALFAAGLSFGIFIRDARIPGPRTGAVASIIKLEPGHSLDGMRRAIELNWPSRTAIAMSSDGRFVVYCAVDDTTADSEPHLCMRRINELHSSPIAGTEGGIAPFLSPDDRWVGFWADGKLKKVSIGGGMAQEICEADSLLGASWGDDDVTVFADRYRHRGLLAVTASGGRPMVLTEPLTAREEHRLPSHLPDGRGYVFTVMHGHHDLNPSVALYNISTGEWTNLIADASNPLYVPTGHLVFLRSAVLMAVPFSFSELDVTGPAVAIRSGILHSLNSTDTLYNSSAGQFSVSASGALVYASGGIIPDWRNSLVWVDHQGNDTPATSRRESYYLPRVSPEGDQIAFATLGTRRQIWLYDTVRDVSFPLITEGDSWDPLWTPDGNRVIFGSSSSGSSWGVFSRSADGLTPVEVVNDTFASEERGNLASISPDGTMLAMVFWLRGHEDIRVLDLRNQEITPFLATQHDEHSPDFSPDGRWITFVSDQDGSDEVYIAPTSGPGGAMKVSRNGGTEPGWSRGGKQLFYRSHDGTQMWAVEVRTEARLSVGKPRLLFERTGLGQSAERRCWDLSPDGLRFLMVKREKRPHDGITEIVLIDNWLEELERLAPTN